MMIAQITPPAPTDSRPPAGPPQQALARQRVPVRRRDPRVTTAP
ncbi:hypothetical protein F750_3097 [Streptomyces sp. PAMC 26508]|nr:hypothetical protein F750_3097 [Streptomyces sp. PAMC 26508]